VIPTKAHELDVSHFIFEFITMLIPFAMFTKTMKKETAPAIPEALKDLRNIKFTKRKTD